MADDSTGGLKQGTPASEATVDPGTGPFRKGHSPLARQSALPSVETSLDDFIARANQLRSDAAPAPQAVSHGELETLRAELEARRGELEASRHELETSRHELEALRDRLEVTATVEPLSGPRRGGRVLAFIAGGAISLAISALAFRGDPPASPQPTAAPPLREAATVPCTDKPATDKPATDKPTTADLPAADPKPPVTTVAPPAPIESTPSPPERPPASTSSKPRGKTAKPAPATATSSTPRPSVTAKPQTPPTSQPKPKPPAGSGFYDPF